MESLFRSPANKIPRLVDQSNERCSRDNPGRYGREYLTIREFRRSNWENYKRLVQELQEMGGGFVQKLIRQVFPPMRRYISEAILYGNDGDRDRLLSQLYIAGGNHRGGMFGFADDETHIHVIHDCPWSDRSCRCRWRKEIVRASFQRATRKNRIITELANDDWYDIVIYFYIRKFGRAGAALWLNGEIQRLPSSGKLSMFCMLICIKCICLTDQIIRWEKMYREFGEMVERIDEDSGFDICEEEQGDDSSSGGNFRTGNDGIKRKKRSVFDTCYEEVQKLLKQHCIAPTSAVKTLDAFMNNRVLINPRNEKFVQAGIECFGTEMNKKTLREYFDFYNTEATDPLFLHGQVYHTREESLVIIDDLMKLQFNDDIELISEFLTTLVNIIDRKESKLNTLVIHSPKSSGKNFFFEMIFGFMLSYGQLGTANKHNHFAFQDAVAQRIILWDEPNYESGITDYLKKVLGASPYSVRVKGKADMPVKRTPVIVLTNTYVDFMADTDFKERLKIYRWRAAPFLKNIPNKPYPLSFFDLLIKYNIIF